MKKKWRIKQIGFTLLVLLMSIGVGGNTALVEATSYPTTSAVTAEKMTLTNEVYRKSTAIELAEMVRSGEVTSTELVNLAIAEIRENDPQLNAVITIREEAALKEASELVDTGQPFLGVPLLLKGLGHTLKGESNTNGVGFLKDQVAGSTGRIAKSFQDAGFIVIGQTNFPEFGLKNISDATLYGPTGTPWNPNYQAGGSSGGSGASVAAGMVAVASGSDAGGSIRIPASWTGTIGLKPTRGVIVGNSGSERSQTVHFPITRSMADTELLFQELRQTPNEAGAESSLANVTVGYSLNSPVGTAVSLEAEKAVIEAVNFLKAQGLSVEEAELPVDGVHLMESYYTIAAGSMGIVNYLANQQLKRNAQIGDVELLTWGLYQTSLVTTREEIDKAWAFSQQAAAQMAEFHQKYQLVLTPATAWEAPQINNPLISDDYRKQLTSITELAGPERKKLIYDQWLEALTLTPFTQLANLTGEPAISLPTHVTASGLPLGIQFNAGLGQDQLLLEIGKLFEVNNKFKLFHASSDEETIPPESSTEEGTTSTTSTEQEHSNTVEEMSETTIETEGVTPSTMSSDIRKKGATVKQMNKENKSKVLPQASDHSGRSGVVVGLVIMTGSMVVFLFKKRSQSQKFY